MVEFLEEVSSALAQETPSMSLEALGRQMNVVGGPGEQPLPKNVGLLFFNQDPRRFFPVTQIDVVYFPDGPGGDRFEEKEFTGPLAQITRDAIAFIERGYLKQTVIKHPDRPEAERFWNFPLAAIEEAIVNAVYHRSYEIREPVEVRITPEELVVLSFPGPDRSIDMDDLRAGRAVSRRYRNRRVGEFLKELDLCEGRSTGIRKILRAMAANGSPEPMFETDEYRSSFVLRLPVHERALQPAHVEAHVEAHVGAHVGDLTDTEWRLLSCCRAEARGTSELLEALGHKSRTGSFKRSLAHLLELELLEMTIPDKPRSRLQRYRLTTAGRALLVDWQGTP